MLSRNYRKPITILVFSIILVFSNKTFSQDLWTLQKCITYSRENNLQIKQQQIVVERTENISQQSNLNFLPSINAGADQSYMFGRTVDRYTNEFTDTKVRSNNFYINASLELFNGLTKYYGMKRDETTLLASEEELKKIENDIALLIANSYLQILYNREALTNAEQQLAVTRLQVERTQKFVEAGSLPEGSLLEIKSQEAQEELIVIQTQNSLNISYLTLKQILDLNNTNVFEIEIPTLTETNNISALPAVEETYQAALGLPQIKSAEYRLESTVYSQSIARGGRLPRLELGATYYTGYSDARKQYILTNTFSEQLIGYVGGTQDFVYQLVPNYNEANYNFKDQITDNASTQVSLSLTIPIFNKWSTQTAISNSHLEIQNMEYNLQIQKNNLYKEIQQAHADALAAASRYEGSLKAVQAMEQSFKYTQQKYEVGLLNYVDYTNAKNQLTKAQSDLLQAKYEFVFRKLILDFYAGKELTL